MSQATPKNVAQNLRALAADLERGKITSRVNASARIREVLGSLRKAKAVRLDANTRRKANAAMTRLGLDGTKPMPSFSRAVVLISDALDIYGLVIDDIVSPPHSDDGSITYAIGIKPPEGSDPFTPPEPVGNTLLSISWHKFEVTHNYEIIAYLS